MCHLYYLRSIQRNTEPHYMAYYKGILENRKETEAGSFYSYSIGLLYVITLSLYAFIRYPLSSGNRRTVSISCNDFNALSISWN